MKHLKIISNALTILVLVTASTFANVQQGQTTTTNGQDIPHGLWEALAKARLLIEPARDTSKGARFSGQNPANRLRFTFNENGVVYYPSNRPGDDWSLGMQLASYGGIPISTQKLHLDGNRVTLDRGDVQEWYVNHPEGLEQGFTLAAPPADVAGNDIILSMTLTGDLQARWRVKGESVQFYTNAGDYVFSYDKLIVTDVDGNKLPANMQLAQNELQLRFDASDAAWPVTVDPLSYTEAKLQGRTNSAQTDDRFGFSVALAGDKALIGAPDDDVGGAAYLFKIYDGKWYLDLRYTSYTPVAEDHFGFSVALSNDMVVIGAYGDDTAGTDAGAIYTDYCEYEYCSYNLYQESASDADDGDWFGYSVAVEGTGDYSTIITGAPKNDDGGADSGSAYIYDTYEDSLTLNVKIVASDAAAQDNFGYSVAISPSEDRVLVGARLDDDAGTASGSAYVFSLSGTWSQTAKLTASDAEAGDTFGHSVALTDTTALVGAYCEDEVASCAGAAYVFYYSTDTTSWAQQAKLTTSDGAVNDFFGYSLALDGDTALIGANQDDDGGTDSGSAYVFTRSGTTWTEDQKLVASDDQAGDNFGVSVALDGSNALVGANKGDSAVIDGGSAYLFSLSGTWSEQKIFYAVNYDSFGSAVALYGDTALVGAKYDDEEAPAAGAAYVFIRSGSTWSLQQKLTAYDAAKSGVFGEPVALWGDTALIGANESAYVFTRNSGTWTQQQKLTSSDGESGDYFGEAISLWRDTALIGASGDDDNGNSSGSAYVFTRIGTTWTQQEKLTASDGVTGDSFSDSVSLYEDTAFIGAPYDGDDGAAHGSVYVFNRDDITDNWLQEQKLGASDAATYSFFGISIALSGDTALIGASGSSDGYTQNGAAYVFTRIGTTWSQQAKLITSVITDYGFVGDTVALSGDDVALIGDDTNSTLHTYAGAAFVFIRTPAGWTQQAQLFASDAEENDRMGNAVALHGDTAIIGAHYAYCEISNCGAAYVYHFPCGYGRGVIANRWTMIGVPCEPDPGSNTVEDILGDNFNPSRYYSRWIVYDRNESTDAYEQMRLDSPMVLGQGYWLISLDAMVWDANGTETPRDMGQPNCPSADGCYVIDLTPPAAAGPARFNLIGHVFSFDTEWADVRFEVDGTAYTPTQAESAGFAEKEMWIYNGNAYDVWDDDTAGMEGTLEAQDGIWVAVLNAAAGKTVKLLVPVFNTFGTPPPPPTLP